jgi:hypothetical protein
MNSYKDNRRRRSRVIVLLNDAEIAAVDRLGISSGKASRSETIRALVIERCDIARSVAGNVSGTPKKVGA